VFPESEWISFDNLGVALKVVVGGQKGETGIPALFRRKWMKTHNALSTKKGLKITCFFPTQTIADLGPTVSLSLCCLCLSHFSHNFEEALFS